VLSMKCEDEKWRPVAYISKLLNEAERNYENSRQGNVSNNLVFRGMEEFPRRSQGPV